MKHKRVVTILLILISIFFATTQIGTTAQVSQPLSIVREIHQRHVNEILALNGVVGIGITKENNTLMLLVAINPDEGDPQLAGAIEGVPVKVINTGEMEFATATNPEDHQQAFPQPVPMGVQTVNAVGCGDAEGTLGFRVRDRHFPNAIGYVTNNHIATGGVGGCLQQAPLGTFEFQPTCTWPNTAIGTLNRYIPLVLSYPDPFEHTADAAFVEAIGNSVSSQIFGIGVPSLSIVDQDFLLGEMVQKSGRTTGVTQSTVIAIYFTFDIPPSNFGSCGGGVPLGVYRFVDQILVDNPGGNTFVDGGDSGSPVLTMARNPVGLVFARPREVINGELMRPAAVCPIRAVLDGLEVDLDISDAPSVTVISPNGGESWQTNSTQTISWSSSGMTGNVKIELSRDGGSSFTTLFASTANDGSENWAVTGPATTQARVKISSVDTPAVNDISNANFTISDSSGPSITVTAPNGGEVWARNSRQTIYWTSSGVSGNVNIELSRNGGVSYEMLYANTPNDGFQQWVVTGSATTQALIRISSVSNPAVVDTSNGTFTITQ